ncbi:MAG TPA: right-handed parallel beta-helix repeat-containing protein [Armatimonadota bacterium]|jgi:hypothetical protein
MSMGQWREGHPNPLTISVGPARGATIRGEDNVALQAAVDYVAGVGGGQVEVQPGTYLMHDSLHLRSHVTVRGAGADTVLLKPPAVSSALSTDIAYGHWDVSLAEPDKFRPGMGVYIYDDNTGGFARTVATLLYRDGDRFGLSRAIFYDYGRCRNALVTSVYPLISGVNVEEAAAVGLLLEGNQSENPPIDGCRGGGLYLIGCRQTYVGDVTVQDVNGDGVSFQQCSDPVFEGVRSLGNSGTGFHPGSGSLRFQMRRLVSANNGADGLFYCVRATDGVLEDSEFSANVGHGLSIGNRDTDQIVRGCLIQDNGGAGVYFRDLDEPTAAHNVQLLGNRLLHNCQSEGRAEIDLDGEVRGTVIRDNEIHAAPGKPGIRICSRVLDLEMANNQIEAEVDVVDERPG